VHADVARGPALTPASAKTVTVMTSDAQEALRNAAGTMQTGPSIAAASLGGRSTEDAVARSGRATKVALIAVLSAIVVAGALALVRNAAPKPSAPATTPSAQDAPIAMPAEDRAPAVDLGSSGATLPRPMEGASSEAERAGAERNEPAPAASAFGGAKPPLENRRKQGLSPPAQGISSGSGKPPVKNRPRLPPTAEPGRDLMEP
jgi:hypothetical protein